MNLVPDYVSILVNLRDFFIRTNKIGDDSAGSRNCRGVPMRRLGNDVPEWLAECCQKVVLNYIRKQEASGNYEYHFPPINMDTHLPYEESVCWSVLSEKHMKAVNEGRSKIVADFLHSEASEWNKQTAELNKRVERKGEWVISSYRTTRLLFGLKMPAVDLDFSLIISTHPSNTPKLRRNMAH